VKMATIGSDPDPIVVKYTSIGSDPIVFIDWTDFCGNSISLYKKYCFMLMLYSIMGTY